MAFIPCLLAAAGYLLSDEAAAVLKLSSERKEQVHFWSFWVGAGLLAIHVILSIWHCFYIRRVTRLEADLENAMETRDMVISNAQALCDGYLQDLARGPLAFGSRTENCERITLYVHDSEQHFQPIGRFSFNQSFIKRGRSRYPDKQGSIGYAWLHSWSYDVLPDPKVEDEAWQEACKRLLIPKTTASNMNMKSALYCSCSVQNNGSTVPVAVLVVESTDPNRYTEAELKAILSDDRRNYIARLVEMLKPWLGDTGEARKRGF